MDIVERLREKAERKSPNLYRKQQRIETEAADEIERLQEVRDMLQAINEAKDKEIEILRAEKHLAALKEGE